MFPFCIPATPFRHALTLRPVFFCLYFTGCFFLRLFWEGRTQLIVATVPHCGTPARETALCHLLRRPQSISGLPSRRAGIIYNSYFIKSFMQDVFFYLFSSVCAADKWRFFTEKLLCPRFASPAKWRFITEKIENFSIFSPLSGACAVLAPDNLRVGCHFFRKKTHVAIWKTVWYGICKKVYPRGISVQKNS